MEVSETRPLTADEAGMLGLLLVPEFPGVAALRIQARSAVVVGGCACGCPSVAFEVLGDVPLASGLASRLIPAEGVVSAEADGLPGQIILFVDDGRLSYLEYVFYGGVPAGWPSADRVAVTL